jgi:hypothetical protein
VTWIDALERLNAQLLDDLIEDENRDRDWELTLIGTDESRHVVPLRCSRKLIRKVKLAVFAAGGDAFAVESELA